MTQLAERPALVRDRLAAAGVDGFILPRGDEHLGEYVPACAERLAWLTGFTGSAGLAILLRDAGAVFSDGRYVTQMADQVDDAIWQRRHVTLEPPSAWLAEHAKGLKVGYDPKLMSESMLDIVRAPGVELVPLDANPIDAVWADRPAPPASRVTLQPDDLSGESSASKRARLAGELKAAGEQAFVLCDTTSVAWLLNIRADDVPCTPVALAFAILRDDASVDVFIDRNRLDEDVLASFGDSVRVHAPDHLELSLDALCHKTVRLDRATTPQWFAHRLETAAAHPKAGGDPCTLPKARKNAVEQEGARAAHALDSVALVRFLYWFERHGTGQHETALSAKLNAFRAQSPRYLGESFEAISGAGPNGAVIHYRAAEGRDRVLAENEIYLIDSGGQYRSGTTDVTRTLWSGPGLPGNDVREAYTRVLKGNIALSRARFPAGTTGHRLDTLARMALWQAGLDYDHGTGHGIGSYLSVHEGPCNISAVPRPVALEPGMIISNEPGFYRPGAFGMRIENLLLVRASSVAPEKFLEFETLTFAPFARILIAPELLSPDEVQWIDAYHAQVQRHLAGTLEPDVAEWLARACAPLA
ncbi:aminopeptidase P family protein [Tanticharoenia sakaeratensis]|uniref:Xaa-Pro aminopeptidase n=1 Tax=Tanticharoenia sakaeratensis NBRC 103193 TaxID=1231623 RepID=A0A0D6MIX0_9PROT|nr:aminopeptidase P family protein [Tanticharoenia sakaeratensis]GAN53395.1 Xaa-Pro aminopeptidase [Tanticharoenia sakaeratensis NBRC 103193]GBQ20769.1 Xaa-Pro aminopeptidase [Tanticharoenia sakaeratensis NBRC 103193]